MADGEPGFSKKVVAAIDGVTRVDNALKSMYLQSENFFTNIEAIGTSLSDITSSIPGLEGVSKIIREIGSVVMSSARAIDGFGEAQRRMTKENLEISSSMGEGIDKASEFNERMIDISKTNSELSAGGFFINKKDTSEVFSNLKYQLADSRNDILEYSGTINGVAVSGEHMVAALKEVSGLDNSYYYTLNELISKNGLTFEQAIGTIASYKDVASNTGLSVQSVSQALSGSVSGFSKLGVTVDFARPALEGFAQSMKKMGLGISESTDLARALSGSLLNVANDYGKAYVMFQQGNLDFGGGGGALGASIGYRAKMLDATPEEQEEIGLQMINAMKDTLTKFTGNAGIVSVKDAAQSPELQTKYFAQEQLLSSMFGMSDQGQRDRTLELLKDLEEATISGDMDRADSVAKQLDEAMEGRKQTKSMEERLGAIAEGSYAEHVKQTAFLQKSFEIQVLSNENLLKTINGGELGKDDNFYTVMKKLHEKMAGGVRDSINSIIGELGTSNDDEKMSILNRLSEIPKPTEYSRMNSDDSDDASSGGGKGSGRSGSTYNLSVNVNGAMEKDAFIVVRGDKAVAVNRGQPGYAQFEAGFQSGDRITAGR